MVKKVSSTEARQGSRGRPVLLILIAGLFLIVVGYFIVGAIGYSTQPDGDTLEPDSTRTTSEQSDSVVVSPQDSQTAD
jgi:flagellar basal body-associated protein FliL